MGPFLHLLPSGPPEQVLPVPTERWFLCLWYEGFLCMRLRNVVGGRSMLGPPFFPLQKTSRQAGVSLLLLHFFPQIKTCQFSQKSLEKLPEGSVGSSDEERGFPSLPKQGTPAGNSTELFPTLSTPTRAKGNAPTLSPNFPPVVMWDFSVP